MLKIVLASKNKGKIKEIERLTKALDIKLIRLDAFARLVMPPESGGSFEINALEKARFISRTTGLAALADDSGLEVTALDNRPGVLSARYAGPCATDDDNIDKLLDELRTVKAKDRAARFVCSIAFVYPLEGGALMERTFSGYLAGEIIDERRGRNGFGYDPVFLLPKLSKTTAELDDNEKNAISHRGRALVKFIDWLTNEDLQKITASMPKTKDALLP